MSETINILECPSCGAKHEQLHVQNLNCPQPPYTHFYICPTSADPVLFNISIINGKKTALHQDIMRNLAVAHSYGKYLFVVGYEESPQKMTVAWVTHEFTSARFEEFVATLQKDFRGKHDFEEGLPKAGPAPYEGELNPMINLFGGE